jgi:hypothetical protein
MYVVVCSVAYTIRFVFVRVCLYVCMNRTVDGGCFISTLTYGCCVYLYMYIYMYMYVCMYAYT